MYNNRETEFYEGLVYQLRPFCVDALRRVSVLYIVWLLTALVFSWVVYFIYQSAPLSSIRPSLFIYYLVVTIHVVHRFKNSRMANVLSPEMVFMFVYTLFNLGYVTLYALKFAPYFTAVFVFEGSIPKALFIVNLGLVAFLLGYEVMGVKRGKSNEPGATVVPTETWCLLGLITIIVAFLIHTGVIVYLGLGGFFQKYGYRAFQNVEWATGSRALGILWRQGLHLMVFGLVVCCVSSAVRYGKLFKFRLSLVLVIIFFGLIVLEGDRGPLLMLGVPLLLIRHYFIKRVPLSILAGVVFAGFFLFAAMGVMRTIVFKPTKMIEEYKYQKEAGAVQWISPIVEMGGSFLVVNITAHEVPSQEPYWLGESWKQAAVHIVPFLSGYFAKKGWGGKWDPSTWLKVTYYGPMRAGRGFTIVAEGYLNFGFPGVFVELMFLGIFIRWLIVKFGQKPSAMWGVIMLGCIGPSIMLVRSNLSLVANVYVRVMLLAALMSMFLGNEPEYVYELESGQMEPSDFEAQHY